MRDDDVFFVSQEFHGSGQWIIHRAGGNRPDKIGRFDTKEEADEYAKRINTYIRFLTSRKCS